jgi:TPR repeat protein
VGALALKVAYLDEGIKALKDNNGELAVKKLKPLALIGDKTAQLTLADAYALGTGGVERNASEAVYWFRRLGSFGPIVVEPGVDPAATYALYIGKTFASGEHGVVRDLAESRKWLMLAAEGGSKEAAEILAKTPR